MHHKSASFNFVRIIILLLAFSFSFTLHAQTDVEEAILKREAELKAELAATEVEIAQWQGVIEEKRTEAASLSRDAALLNAKIKEAQLVIKARNLAIERLGEDITDKEETIEELLVKIEKGKESIAQIIRKTNEIDSYSVIEMVLSSKDLSEFFKDIDSFDSVNKDLERHFNEIRETKNLTEKEKESLATKKNQEIDTKVAVETEKKKVEANEAEKKRLLSITKNQEKAYGEVLKERQRKAAEIRSALFSLRDSAAIPFGTALEYAKLVSDQTGVRPAFLLAILTQETNLGKNVGTCNRPGDPPEKHWTQIMPGPDAIKKGLSKRNDQAIFVQIMEDLGLSTEGRPLSCPWGAGWGGAMGPAQFIPTTWASYAPKIAAALGVKTPNPWEPLHAFMASGTYLGELGANVPGYTSERTAALKYYAGGAWANPKNAFYGDQVMAKAGQIQENMINPLEDI
jgi:peptidoglycan hydrolase CwlO-like protein